MSEKRDRCWIRSLEVKGLSSYYLPQEKESIIRQTIKNDIGLLFKNIKESEKEEASIVFEETSGKDLGSEGYRIEKRGNSYSILGHTDQAWLYGLFGLHRLLGHNRTEFFPYIDKPDQSIRMINHWDNFDGSIERGYAGDSIFYTENKFRKDYEIIKQYARFLASVGINAVSINNVNVHREEVFFLEEDRLLEIKKIADIFEAYGVKMFLALNFASPIILGNLSSADPLEPQVEKWWKQKLQKVYEIIPGFGGIVVKADSEGEPGPFTYGRNHADGANMLARAIKDQGGIVIWRCFVYNCSQKYWQREIDRAKAAYDIFSTLDGCFEENVILQIKNGPIDFQIREPVSPLFGKLRKTNQILEFQITQEYTGHQKDICYLIPMWKETMDFDTKYGEHSTVKELLKVNSIHSKYSGIAAVGSIGMDSNWTGNKLAQANFYGFGRLIWNNNLSSEEIAAEWIDLSFDLSVENKKKLKDILLTSRETYELYTCPLGVGFMCKPKLHYGVDIDGYEYDNWGTYHYADRDGVGRERSVATGTGYTRQYSDERYEEYESLETCPDELLLFFHHVPYTHILHSGKTVIQHIYDTHFQGVERVKEYLKIWKELEPEVDKETFENVQSRLLMQIENAENWRNQINTYFYRKSGIADQGCRKIYK